MRWLSEVRRRLLRFGPLPAVGRIPVEAVAQLGYSSQLGQDVLVDRLLAGRRDGVFVDVGAHDGVTLSNSYFFERERGWSGVCIEPSPEVFPRLAAARSAICVNAAIGPRGGTAEFNMIEGEGEMLSGMSSAYSARHRRRLQADPNAAASTAVTVNVRRLDEVLREHWIHRVDLLSIDVEGGEAGVLDSITMAEFSVEFVFVENNYSSLAIRRRMWKQGYQLLMRLGWDDLYVPRGWSLPSGPDDQRPDLPGSQRGGLPQ